MNVEQLPQSALDLARQGELSSAGPMQMEQARHHAIHRLVPKPPEPDNDPPVSAQEIAQMDSAADSTSDRRSPSPRPVQAAASLAQFAQQTGGSASIAFPEASFPAMPDLSSTLQQQIETTVRVERELKIEIEDNIEELAQRTGDYLVTQLDQREQQLLERVAQQINQQPTRRAHLAGPGTTVGG